jgi:transcriptional regulator with XRE-family HTH domain
METPEYALRLKQAREKTGMSPAEVSTAAGIHTPAYYDLESSTDLTNACTLDDIARISHVLGIRPDALFASTGRQASHTVPLRSVIEAIANYCTGRGLTVAAFGVETGWDMTNVMDSPAQAVRVWNVDCLRAVCEKLGLDWLAVMAGLSPAR